jgi:hypothetical protein
MKTSIKFALLAFGAVSMAALMTASASAQVVGGSNCSKWRDQTKGTRQGQCLTVKTDTQQAKEGDLRRETNYRRFTSFIIANPPSRVTKAANGATVYDGVNRAGEPYRIVSGRNAAVGSGSASRIYPGTRSGLSARR